MSTDIGVRAQLGHWTALWLQASVSSLSNRGSNDYFTASSIEPIEHMRWYIRHDWINNQRKKERKANFTSEFYQKFKEELTPSITNSSKEKKATLPKLFSEVSISLIPKLDNCIKRKVNSRPVCICKCRCEKPQQNSIKLSPATYKKDYAPWQVGFIPGMQDWSNIWTSM